MLTYHTDNCAAACTCEWKGKGNREGTERLQENNKMEIKQLEYFAAAVEYGSLNRAAEKLYTTQPNVSRVLNSLEKELHVTLLERSNKGIKMTPQGEESCDEHLKTLQCHPFDVGAAEREKIFGVRLQEWPAHKTDGAAVSGR